MPAAPYDAGTIARWFLAWSRFDDEGVISNLKLQKLLYYAQGHYMATHEGNALFADDIQAWGHGPVVPAVYHAYKHHGAGPIPAVDFDFEAIDQDSHDWLAAVWKTFGAFSAWRLREMTHSEPPWKDSYREGARSTVIDPEILMRYFGGLYVNTKPV